MKKIYFILIAISFIMLFKTNTYSNNSYNDELFFDTDSVGVPTATDTIGVPTVIDKQFVEKLKLYPNPTTNTFYVDVPSNNTLDIQIYNVAGSLVKTYHKYNTKSVDINDLDGGLYIVKIIFNEKIVHKYKILVKK